MRALWACIKKDVLLFLSRKSGIVVLVLPVLLLLVMLPGFGETAAAGSFVKPFRIVIQDLDNSVMSRSLVNQLRAFDLFEEIETVRSEEVDVQDYFERGFAAVMTVPDNFFYAMYDMDNATSVVALNPDMPAETAILESILTSVSDIVAAEQNARKAEYLVLTDAGAAGSTAELYYESANYELRRALGRADAFSDTEVIQDYADSSLHAAWATVVVLMSLLIPLCVLKSLPEELSVGILDRLRCSDSGEAMLLGSKYLAALLIFLIPATVVTLIALPPLSSVCIAGILFGFTASFAFFSMLSFRSASASKTQLTGNILLVLSMLAGGALYPYRLLPPVMQTAAYFTLPYHMMSCMNGDTSSLFALGAFLLLFTLGAVLSVRRQKRMGKKV